MTTHIPHFHLMLQDTLTNKNVVHTTESPSSGTVEKTVKIIGNNKIKGPKQDSQYRLSILLLVEGIIRPVVSVSALTWFIRYNYY
jgi:hypothetical protein